MGIASILTVVVNFWIPAGPRCHFRLSGTDVRSSWVAGEGGKTYEGKAVHRFHEDASPFAGSPAFSEFSECSLEECLLTEVSLWLPSHDITILVLVLLIFFRV